MKVRLVAAFVALTALLATPVVALADSSVWVEVQGSNIALPEPRPAYTLEIGDLGWRIPATGFVGAGKPVVVAADVPLVVRVRRLSDCAPVVSFVAKPGTSWIIRFVSGSTLRVEDWSKNGLDAIGGMPAGGRLLCPRLPDTATVAGSQPVDPPTPPLFAGAAGVVGLGLVAIRLRRRNPGRLAH